MKTITGEMAERMYHVLHGSSERLAYALDRCGEDPKEYDLSRAWSIGMLGDLCECSECGLFYDDAELDDELRCPECAEASS